LSLSLWRDISVVWLSLLCFIGLIIPLAVAYFSVRGMDAALRYTGAALDKAQQLSSQVRMQTGKASHRIIEPVIKVNRQAAKWQEATRVIAPSSRPSSNVQEKDHGS
jgi:hypothetical protein